VRGMRVLSCLTVAAAGLGMRSSFALLRAAGWRIVVPMVIGSLWLASAMLAGGWMLQFK